MHSTSSSELQPTSVLDPLRSSRKNIVAVVGLGKIGLPLAVQYARHGRRVIGCDIDLRVVKSINTGRSHIQEEPGLAEGVADLVSQGLLSATLHTSDAVRQASTVVVIVPIVIDEKHEVNFETIDAATTDIGTGLQSGTLVIYESTMPVGTTSQRLASLLERSSKLKAGRDFLLAFSPERVSSGFIFRDLSIYPKVVGGIDEQSTTAATAFYQSVLDASIIAMASTEEAEFVKLIETTYRDVNIALANEYACYADAHGLNAAAAIAAANTQPYSHIHTPSVGVGGHCIPVYPYFLLSTTGKQPSYYGSQSNSILPLEHSATTPPRLSSLREQGEPVLNSSERNTLLLPYHARRINDAMAEYAVQRIETSIGSLAGRSVLILGVAYRGGVREPAFTSAKLLKEALLTHDATVYIDDPLFTQDELRALGYIPLTPNFERDISAIILQADHQSYQSLDFKRFSQCQAVLDGRRFLSRETIESLGIKYLAIGDGGSKAEPYSELHTTSVFLDIRSETELSSLPFSLLERKDAPGDQDYDVVSSAIHHKE